MAEKTETDELTASPLQSGVMQPCIPCGGTGEELERYDGDDYCDGCDAVLDLIQPEAELVEILEALINEYSFEEVAQSLNFLKAA